MTAAMLFLLKYAADLSYYMVYAAFVASALGVGQLAAQGALLCAAALLCRLLERAPAAVRALPALLAPLCALALPAGWPGALFALPPALYLGVSAYRALYALDRGESTDHFLLMLKLLPLPALGALALGGSARFTSFSFPWLMGFLFGYVLLLRMLRHDEEVVRQRRFRLLNALELAAAALVALGLFSPQFRAAVGGVLKLAYNYVVAPILMLVSYVFVVLAWPLSRILRPLDTNRPVTEMPPELSQEDPLSELLANEERAPSELLASLLIALAVIAAVFLLYRLFRRLLGQRREAAADGTGERREFLEEPPRPPKRGGPFGRTPAQQVRHCYRRYLQQARARGASFPPSLTSLQQRRQAGDYLKGRQEEQDALRALYLNARYGERAEREDARAARTLLDAVKRDGAQG